MLQIYTFTEYELKNSIELEILYISLHMDMLCDNSLVCFLTMQLVLSKQSDLCLGLTPVKDVWRSAITTSGVLFVTMVLIQVMPEQRAVKLVILENLSVGLL